MEINIPTAQDILRDTAIQYANKAFVYITDCNPPLMTSNKSRKLFLGNHSLMHVRYPVMTF